MYSPRLMRNLRKMLLILAAVLTLTACQAEGMPGSRLLTPAAQLLTATPSETTAAMVQTTSATNTPEATHTPGVTLLAEATETPEVSATPQTTASPTASPTEAGTPTFGPSPTRTRTPTPTRFPSRTPLPSRTPTITPTPSPPQAWMRIQRPGPYSRVVSPISIEALISPGEDGYVHVELTGEDGRLITRQALDLRAFLNRHFYIAPEIPFEIQAAAETARLTVRVEDRFNRPIYLCSVDLVLMQLGKNDILPQSITQEPFLVRLPREGAVVRGGVLQVNGLARLINDNPLNIALVDEQNRVVGSVSLEISQPYGDLSHIPFQTYIPYTVTESSGVRMLLFQESNTRIPGVVWLSSMLLTLEP